MSAMLDSKRVGRPIKDHERHMVPTSDGRELEVLVIESGKQSGLPLVFYHWTPGAAVPFPILERAALERDLRVISYSRPAYGLSDPRLDASTTATVADDATDTATILNHLGLDDFITIAWSGGGPRAFACAAVLSDRCRAAASLASPVPPDAEGLAQVTGMRRENAALYTLATKDKDAFTAVLEQQLAPLLDATDDQLREWFRNILAPPDQARLTGELGEYLVACMRHSVYQGVAGWRDDLLTYRRPWGFDVSRIGVPISVWHGTGRESWVAARCLVQRARSQRAASPSQGRRAHLVDSEDRPHSRRPVGAGSRVVRGDRGAGEGGLSRQRRHARHSRSGHVDGGTL